MSCLLCEERIPRLRELFGSQFCSEEHRRTYASRQPELVAAGDAVPARASAERHASALRLADFSNLAVIRETFPDLRGSEIPISRYCDLMLAQSRRRSRNRSAMPAPGARIVLWMPAAAAPGEARPTSCVAIPKAGSLALGVSLAGFSQAPAGLPGAGFLTALPAFQATPPQLRRPAGVAIEFQRAQPVVGLARPAPAALPRAGYLPSAPAFQDRRPAPLASEQRLAFEPALIIIDAAGSAAAPLEIDRPAFSTALSAGFLTSLLAFGGAISESQTPPKPSLELRPVALPDLEQAPFTGLLPAEFLMPQSEPLPASPEPAQFPAEFRPHAPEVVLSVSATPQLAFDWNSIEKEPRVLAGFVIDRPPEYPESQLTFSSAKQTPAGFRLEPVWLPALFAMSEPAGPRTGSPWSIPRGTAVAPAGGRYAGGAGKGPSFSGLLAWPQRGGVYWEFRETWSPPGVVELNRTPDPSSEPAGISPWAAVLQYWRSTPAMARRAVLAVPLMILALFVIPSLSLQTPALGLSSITEAARARATVDLEDDFHSGFEGWTGKEGWAKSWSFDGAGSARPGSLALLRESIPLKDYHVEFLGQIDTKALGFVLRAADIKNYQAVKLAVVKPGPLPSLALVRYAVIDGREGPKTQTPLTLGARSDTLYKLVVDVQGDHFSVLVNGVYAGSWTEERLKSGGVGFFADKGEGARLRWVHLIDKQDFLGWICYQVSQWTADRRTSGVGVTQ